MSDLFLIAHKVRGEAAFDVAQQMRCPICEPMRQGLDDGSAPIGCAECDDGFWWIIPTSGHRAYPYWHIHLANLYYDLDPATLAFDGHYWKDYTDAPPCPSDWPDHYAVNNPGYTPSKEPSGLLARLGLVRKEPIKRRI